MEDEEQTSEQSIPSGELGVNRNENAAADAVLMTTDEQVGDQSTRPSRKKRRLTMTAVGVVLALAISLVVIGASGPGASDASAQVMLGARTTLAKNSVALTLSGSLTANGQTIPVSGSGSADVSTNLESLTMAFNEGNTPVQETVLADGSAAYMQFSENSQNEITQLIPGKQWVQVPVGETSSTGLGASTPNILNQLQILTQQGNTVVSLGSSTINGEAVNGYQVTITKEAMRAEFKKEERQGGAVAQALQQALKVISLQPPVIKVWLNSDHLLTREEVLITESAGGVTASGDLIVNFSDYGSAASISTPASGSVASFNTFIAAAKAAAAN
jgi:hypothetical protein